MEREPKIFESETHDSAGVDLSLIVELLQLTPLERLLLMERAARDQAQLAEYGRRHREAKAPQ
jgi:hypothetical protein